VTEANALTTLAALAREGGTSWVADEADTLAHRLGKGRFYVVCVGQFKRGKSTLLNALIGTPILPTGVVPSTAAVTVIRYGDRLAAPFASGIATGRTANPVHCRRTSPKRRIPATRKT
jgi:Dynamin family